MKSTIISVLAAMSLIAFGFSPSVHAQSAGTSIGSDMSSPRSFQISELVGKDVKGIYGEKVGTLDDFVVDPSGHVFALVSSEDTAKTIVIPPEAIASIGADDTLNLNITKEQVATAPEFTPELMASRSWSKDIYRQYGAQPSWSGQNVPGETAPMQGRRYHNKSEFRSMNGSYDIKQMLGKDVKGIQGEHLGTIRDFMIDPNGHVFALLSSADTGRTIAVPFEAFSSLGRDDLSLNRSKDQIARVPDFDQGVLADPSWSRNLYTQYGIQPGFSQGMMSQYGPSRQSRMGRGRTGMMAGSSFDLNQLSGQDVKGMNGETIGSIQNFVVDPAGHVFAVVAEQDTGKKMAVPLEAFSSVSSDNILHLGVSKDQLAKAPEFDKSRLSDRAWTESVYRELGIQPRWSAQDRMGQSGVYQQGQMD